MLLFFSIMHFACGGGNNENTAPPADRDSAKFKNNFSYNISSLKLNKFSDTSLVSEKDTVSSKLYRKSPPTKSFSSLTQQPEIKDQPNDTIDRQDTFPEKNKAMSAHNEIAALFRTQNMEVDVNEIILSEEEIKRYLQPTANKDSATIPSSAWLHMQFADELLSYDFETAFRKIFEMTNLRGLDLCCRKLEDLPGTIGNLKNLQVLILRDNLLESLPASFQELKALVYLDLRGNQFTAIPEVITRLPNLRYLKMVDNAVRKIPITITNLNHLKELSISFSDTLIDATVLHKISLLDSLRRLNIHNINRLPDHISRLKRLNELSVRDANFKYLPKDFGTLPQLQTISFYNTPELDLQNTFDVLGQLPALEALDLSCCMDTLPQNINKLYRLKKLHLFNTDLTFLPASIGDLTQLRSINLSKNYLNKIPFSIGQMSALRSISLSDNSLDSIPSSIGQLSKLTHLRLSDNNIKRLPETIQKLTALEHLDLSNNPIQDSEKEQIKHWLPDCRIQF